MGGGGTRHRGIIRQTGGWTRGDKGNGRKMGIDLAREMWYDGRMGIAK